MNKVLSEKTRKLEDLLSNKTISVLNKREHIIKNFVHKLCELACSDRVPRPVMRTRNYYVNECAVGNETMGICEDCVQREYVMKTSEGRFLCNSCLDRATGGLRTASWVQKFKGVSNVPNKKKKSSLIDELVAALIFNLVGDQTNLQSSLKRWIRDKPTIPRRYALSTFAKMGLHVVLAEQAKTKEAKRMNKLYLPERYIQALDRLVATRSYPNRAEVIREVVRNMLSTEVWKKRSNNLEEP